MNAPAYSLKRTASLLFFAFTISLLTGHAHPVVSTGLQAYYPFNGNTNDQSGNGLPLTLAGGVLGTDRFGVANQAMSFADNLSIASFNYSLAGKSFSLGAWFYLPLFSPVTAGGFAQGDVGSPGLAFRLMTDYYSENNLRYSFWFDDFDYVISGRNRGQWIHIFATFDNETRVRKIYINGALVASNVAAYGFSGSGPLRFGFMAGSMDEVRVYNRVLSGAEVGQIYSSELHEDPHADCYALLAELAAEVENLHAENVSLSAQLATLNQQIVALQQLLAQSQGANAALQAQQAQASAGLDEIWRLLQQPPGQRTSTANYSGPLGAKINQIIRALIAPQGKTSSNGK